MSSFIIKTYLFIFVILLSFSSFSMDACNIVLKKIIDKDAKELSAVYVNGDELLHKYDYVVNLANTSIRTQCEGTCYHEAFLSMSEVYLKNIHPNIEEHSISVFHSYLDLFLYRFKRSYSLTSSEAISGGSTYTTSNVFKNHGIKYYKTNQIKDEQRLITEAYKEIDLFIKNRKKSNDLRALVIYKVQEIVRRFEDTHGLPSYEIKSDDVGNHYNKVLKNYRSTNTRSTVTELFNDKHTQTSLVEISDMKDIILKSLKKSIPVCIGFKLNTFPKDSIFSLPKNKFKRMFSFLRFGHAVVVAGLKLDDNGKIKSFLILNSNGLLSGDKGFFHMDIDYFEKSILKMSVLEDKN